MNRRSFLARLLGTPALGRLLPTLVPLALQAKPKVVEFRMVSSPVVAKVRKLSATWTCEVAQEMNAFHYARAERLLEQVLAGVVKPE